MLTLTSERKKDKYGRVSLGVKISEEMLDRICNMAYEERRTLTGQVELLLIKALKDEPVPGVPS